MFNTSSRLLVFASLREEGPSKEGPPGRRRFDPGLCIIDEVFPNMPFVAEWTMEV